MSLESDRISETFSELEEVSSSVLATTEQKKKVIERDGCNVGHFVLVLFNDKLYPGKLTLKSKEGCVADCMDNKLKFWLWPRPDTIMYDCNTIVAKNFPPKLV